MRNPVECPLAVVLVACLMGEATHLLHSAQQAPVHVPGNLATAMFTSVSSLASSTSEMAAFWALFPVTEPCRHVTNEGNETTAVFHDDRERPHEFRFA